MASPPVSLARLDHLVLAVRDLDATGNYTRTLLSLSATLSMRFLDEEFAEAAAAAERAERVRVDPAEFGLALKAQLNHNAPLQVLKRRGYGLVRWMLRTRLRC